MLGNLGRLCGRAVVLEHDQGGSDSEVEQQRLDDGVPDGNDNKLHMRGYFRSEVRMLVS